VIVDREFRVRSSRFGVIEFADHGSRIANKSSSSSGQGYRDRRSDTVGFEGRRN
jgi:hypothetical protein